MRFSELKTGDKFMLPQYPMKVLERIADEPPRCCGGKPSNAVFTHNRNKRVLIENADTEITLVESRGSKPMKLILVDQEMEFVHGGTKYKLGPPEQRSGGRIPVVSVETGETALLLATTEVKAVVPEDGTSTTPDPEAETSENEVASHEVVEDNRTEEELLAARRAARMERRQNRG